MPRLPFKNGVPLSFPALQPQAIAKTTSVDQKFLLGLLQQGMKLQNVRRFIDAERLYQTVLSHAPDMPEANNLMGTIAMEAKDYPVAIEYLETAVTGMPRDPFIRHNIASTLIALDDYYSAVPHLRRALDLKPGQVETIALLATCYNRMGKGQDALQFARKALAMDKTNRNGRIALAEAQINLGQMEDAEATIRTTIAMGVGVPFAYQNLSTTRKFSANAPELKEIEKEIASATYTTEQRMPLYYAAAKICNDAMLYDDAMNFFKKAKAVGSTNFDIQRYENRVDNCINHFNDFFMRTRAGFGDKSCKPIFILGMPRSGTTLTEQIIASHPLVAGGGELTALAGIARRLGDTKSNSAPLNNNLMRLTAEESRAIAATYLKQINRISATAARITDKMPHNFEHIGLIALLFPNATIIHCRRNPIDTCLSCYMNAFNEAHGYSLDFSTLGRYYRAYDRLMKHWHALLPGRILDNQYETLVEDQQGQSKKLIAHCNLGWDDACLDYTKNSRAVTTISRWQVQQPIYSSSVQRWKPYEKHLGRLITALGDLVPAWDGDQV